MPDLKPVESLIVDVLMDNQSDSYSSKPSFVMPEFNNVIRAGACEISGTTLCCAQLGYSLLLTAVCNGRRRKLLFDAGPEGSVFVRNCRSLGLDLSDVEEIAITHGHWDHMGALLCALGEITAPGGRTVPCHVNPGMFLQRGARLTDGSVVPFEKVPSPEQLNERGAEVISDFSERVLLDSFYLSGEIPRITTFEKGRDDHLCRESEEIDWRPDPLLMDERYLAVKLSGRGLVVFSACSHAGIVNVLHHVKSMFPDEPVFAVFGGLHLVGALERIIPDTINGLKEFKPEFIMPGHCTGWRALCALVAEFGEAVVVPSAVGSKYNLEGAPS